MAPFGFINDGLEDEYFADAQGDVWQLGIWRSMALYVEVRVSFQKYK